MCAADPVEAGDCEAEPDAREADAVGDETSRLATSTSLSTQNGDTIDCTVDGACVYTVWDWRDFATTFVTAPGDVVTLAPPFSRSRTSAVVRSMGAPVVDDTPG